MAFIGNSISHEVSIWSISYHCNWSIPGPPTQNLPRVNAVKHAIPDLYPIPTESGSPGEGKREGET